MTLDYLCRHTIWQPGIYHCQIYSGRINAALLVQIRHTSLAKHSNVEQNRCCKFLEKRCILRNRKNRKRKKREIGMTGVVHNWCWIIQQVVAAKLTEWSRKREYQSKELMMFVSRRMMLMMKVRVVLRMKVGAVQMIQICARLDPGTAKEKRYQVESRQRRGSA